MRIKDTVALVTGANRGIGLAFTRELLARGARKVYAGARDPSTVKQPGVEVIRLDVTKPDQIAAAAARADDVALKFIAIARCAMAATALVGASSARADDARYGPELQGFRTPFGSPSGRFSGFT